MFQIAALALALAGSGDAGKASPIVLKGEPYNLVLNGSACKELPCIVYPSDGRVSGSFRTNGPLAKDLNNFDISSNLKDFRFDDGRNVIRSANPTARKVTFSVSTDASGALIGYDITVEQTTSKPGEVPKRINAITMISRGGVKGELAFANVLCLDEGPVPAEPKGRTACRDNKIDDNSSRAQHAPPLSQLHPTKPPPPTLEPTPLAPSTQDPTRPLPKNTKS